VEGGKEVKTRNTDIYSDFQNEIREITKPKNRLGRWISDYSVMVMGLLIIISACFYLNHINQDLSQSVSELAPNPDIAKTNLDKIGILLGILSVEMTTFWGLLSLGIALLGVGLAIYVHHSSNRTSQLITAGLSATGRIILRAIFDTHVIDSDPNEVVTNGIATHKPKNVEKEGKS
jgi:hypothetical protein